jgi:hydroxymethylpyrimidine pyrophosphatase-like HAD family hydrolase
MIRQRAQGGFSFGYKTAVRQGLTNKYSDDYGALASAVKAQDVTFALCCGGRTHYNTSDDQCHACGQTLFWQKKEKGIAMLLINKHASKYEKIREDKELKEWEKTQEILFKEQQKRYEAKLAAQATRDAELKAINEKAKQMREEAEAKAKKDREELERAYSEARALRIADQNKLVEAAILFNSGKLKGRWTTVRGQILFVTDEQQTG